MRNSLLVKVTGNSEYARVPFGFGSYLNHWFTGPLLDPLEYDFLTLDGPFPGTPLPHVNSLSYGL